MKALFKFNGGRGALLCSGCRVILKTGDKFTDEEIEAIKGYAVIPAQYCLKCKLINALNENDIEWKEKIVTLDNVKYKVVSFQPPLPLEVLDVIENADVNAYGYLTLDGEQGIDVYFKM